MISLKDKIEKFQKLIYNKQLDEFIPIDEKFISTGITISSLIKENAFIVEEIKKMKNVFVNYCKLNKNVYEKITEHELSLHSETIKLQNISNSVENKINQCIKQIKEMYEQMKYQSQRTQQFVHEAIKPVQDAVKLKVDENLFTMEIKKIMNELKGEDQEPQLIQNIIQNVTQDDHNKTLDENKKPSEKAQAVKKKSKNILREEYLEQQQKNMKLFMQLSQKLEQLQNKSNQYNPMIYKNTSSISKLNLTVDASQNEIFKLNRDFREIKNLITSTEQKLMLEISTKTSETVWQKKLTAFETKFVIPRSEKLSFELKKYHNENTMNFANLEPRFKKINDEIKSLYPQIQRNQQAIKETNKNLEIKNEQSLKRSTAIENKIKSVEDAKKVQIEKINQKIKNQISILTKQIQNIENEINQLAENIQDKVLVTVKKNLEVRLNEIEKNINILMGKQKKDNEEILKISGQIQTIKDVLSKKANFTDLLLHFERKADKEEFKQLKDKFETSPSQYKSSILEGPQKSKGTISSKSRRKRSLSKNLNLPFNEDKTSLDSQNQISTRLYVMGIENEIGQIDRKRMSYTSSTRRNSKIKSSVGIVSIF